MRLAAAGNVLVPAIVLLEERGYSISFARTGATEHWTARRGETELLAEDPLALLGLAGLVEARGSEWPATDEQITQTLARFKIG
jgi:hypothetical protein